MKIDGVIVPLLTPMRPDGSVDDTALGRLITHTIDGGVAAILLLGSTGEAPTLPRPERERLVRLASLLVGGRVPLLAGVIEAGTDLAVEQAVAYQEAGADAVVPTAPMYFQHTQRELARHFAAVAEAVSVPVLLYNIPALVKLKLSPELVRDLAQIPGVRGLKDSDGNLEVFQRYLAIRDGVDDFQVWQGAEAVAAISVARGADGMIVGLANVAPELAVALYAAAARGDLAAAWARQDDLMRLFTIQRHKSFLAGLKAAACLLGLCDVTVSRPFETLDERETASVRLTLVDLGLLPDGVGGRAGHAA